MEKFTNQEINFVIQKLLKLKDGIDINDLNELNMFLGIQEIDEKTYISSNNATYILIEQFKRTLSVLGNKIEELDEKEIIKIINCIDYYYLDNIFIEMSDNAKEKILKLQITYNQKLKILISIKDDDKKVELLDPKLDDPAKIIITNSIRNEEKRLEALNKMDEYAQSVIIKGFKSDKNKIKAIQSLKNSEYKAKAISYLNDDNIKLEMIDQIPKNLQPIIIKTIKDDTIKKELIDKIEDKEDKIELILTLNSDELKLKYMEELNIPPDRILKSLSTEEAILKIMDLCTLSEDEIFNIAISKFKHDESKIKVLNKIQKDDLIEKIISSFEDEEKKIQVIYFIKEDKNKFQIALTFENDSNKLKIIEKMQDEELINKIIFSIKDDNIKLRLLDRVEDEIRKIEIIESFSNDENKLKAMFLIKNKNLSINIRKSLKLETIQKHRKEIMLYEGITENLDQKIKVLEGMEKRNSNIYNTINFQMLDDKIISSFSKEQFEQLVCYPDVERCIIQIINDKDRWKLFFKIFNTISKDTENWDVKLSRILEQLNSKEYQKLINNVADKDVNIEKLIKLIQFPNYFGIKTQEDLNNYAQIKKDICDKIMNDDIDSLDEETLILILQMNDLDQIRFAILQKLYGQDIESTKRIIEKFGQDLDNLDQNSDEVIYVKALKKIMETNNIELLKKYYLVDRGIEDDLIDIIAMENKLKHDYGVQFNEGLLQTKGLEEGEIEGTLKAGTDFRMLITSVSPFVKNAPENYAEDWNRNNITSRGFCCSYITNDMIATAKIPHLCYGFSKMSDDALMLSGPTDIFSDSKFLEAKAKSDEVYYSPENQINNTVFMGIGLTYNEMVFKRKQDGKKKQPDYIVVFKENGRIVNMSKAQKAQAQWKQYGINLPIIVVDKDECAKANRAEIDRMIKECNSYEDYKKIFHKVDNNNKWREGFEHYIKQIEGLKKKFERKRVKEIFKNCYDNTSSQDRQYCTQMLKNGIQNNQTRLYDEEK